MNFRSDNVTGVAPEIMAALAAVNSGSQPSYGDDATTLKLNDRFAALFDHDVRVFPVTTGTAANSLALASLAPPWGAIYCHEEAHIAVDECAAPEFFTGGAKIVALAGADGKIRPETIAAHLFERGFVHQPQPAAISVSQTTEAGTVYRPAELRALADFAGAHGLALHMDGARFGNAVAALGCAPADITWRAGVDVLSFGATKNGALAAEAVVFFDPAKAADFGYRRKRGGHLVSKMRFLSAQLEAYLADGLWLRHARHANRMAAELAAGLAALPGARLKHPVEANEIFVELPAATIDRLDAEGFGFYRWDGATLLRLVTAFDTNPADVAAFLAAAAENRTASAKRP
jgi:threonine aldolase